MRSGLDPHGKRSLFEAPVTAPPDSLGANRTNEGREALYSTGPRKVGTVVVECSGCQARSRTSLLDVGVRLATISVWLPARRHNRWMRCPACGRRRWCRIGWTA